MDLKISTVDIYSPSNHYLFPSSLLSTLLITRADNFLFLKIGSPPFGALAFTKKPIMQSEGNSSIIHIPYFSVLPQFASAALIENVFSFIYANYFAVESNLSFVLNISTELKSFIPVNSRKFSFSFLRSSSEITLEFSRSLTHWQFLWRLFERNYNFLLKHHSLKIARLSQLDASSFADIQSTVPDWADPFNPGFYSVTDSPFNLVLLSNDKPVAWLNSSMVDQRLVLENLWSYPSPHSGRFAYALIYILFSEINNFQLTPPVRNCIFSFHHENKGMQSLSRRLDPFTSSCFGIKSFKVQSFS